MIVFRSFELRDMAVGRFLSDVLLPGILNRHSSPAPIKLPLVPEIAKRNPNCPDPSRRVPIGVGNRRKGSIFRVGTSKLPEDSGEKKSASRNREALSDIDRSIKREREIAGSPGSSPTAGQGRESAAGSGRNGGLKLEEAIKDNRLTAALTGPSGHSLAVYIYSPSTAINSVLASLCHPPSSLPAGRRRARRRRRAFDVVHEPATG
ncbi:hypothetical protein NL676_037118 [Syzygium grande]|nr:hypothetical protein NL676_037118 [Syzygium grande]